MFSYACNLLKMDASSTDFQQCFKKYLPRNPVNTSSYISLPSKLHHKIHRNKADFSSIEKRSKKNRYFEILIFHSWKLRQTKYVETTSIFCSSKIHRRKYFETTSIFRPSKLHRKSTSKWRGNLSIFFLTYRRNINIKLTSIQRGVSGV